MPLSVSCGRIAQAACLVATGLLVASCGDDPVATALSSARPKAAPVRNITSFSRPLACMDSLLSRARRGPVTLSSSDIPDMTRSRPVGADDMLINAISQMNRRSGSYVFIDPTRVRGININALAAEDKDGKDPKPQYYIRGSISQLDRGVHARGTDLAISPTPASEEFIGAATGGRSRTLSVVSVDLHLVHYATRRVLAGASVSNSMVVVGRSWKAGAAGLIDLRPFNLTLEVSRMESESQAVRHLIELGLIELLGKHSGVPYQTCLLDGVQTRSVPQSAPAPKVKPAPPPALTPTVARRTRPASAAFSKAIAAEPRSTTTTPRSDRRAAAPQASSAQSARLRALQTALVIEGYLKTTSGRYDDATREALVAFQVDEGLPPSGLPDARTGTRLQQRIGGR